MMLGTILFAIALLCLSALAAAVLTRFDRSSLAVGTAGSTIASLTGAIGALVALLHGEHSALRGAWSLPLGEPHVALDALSAFFLLCVFVVSGLASLYASGYLVSYLGKRRLGAALAFFNLLIASMAGLVIARDGILFLVTWEVMSFASFFLVLFENEREDVRRAAMTYLIASQFGVVFLFVLFTLLGQSAGTFDFDRFAATGGLADACFVLAVVGFGAKAGFWPLHIWLPDAHPAAPSHVSALMSGVMIKIGAYGLLRTLTFLGPPADWWSTVLLLLGVASGLTGVVHALAQRDLKRRLAYSSVENMGLIALGIGLGLLGQSHGNALVSFFGYSGALLHVLNHGLMKGLLFQAAGSVIHGTGTRSIESLGGLYRRMPTTASSFLVGSIAICGLPPLNGFVGEWLIYVGAFRAAVSLPAAGAVSALVLIAVLALIGGLAAACFVATFGTVFLGEPRTKLPRVNEAGRAMRGAMLVGALLCVAIGLWPLGALRLVLPAAQLAGGIAPLATDASAPLLAMSRVAFVLALLIAVLALLRYALLRKREVTQGVTWSCGYAAPSARMQYTASSFAQPLLATFAPIVHVRTQQHGPSGYFPASAHYEEHIADVAGEQLLIPGTRRLVRALSRLRVIQQGRVQLYVIYIVATLVVLLFWQLLGARG
jgi:formate hydrogenlyase subunit 3/multisubunit Na+/H+ antiporter MnhD subunit